MDILKHNSIPSLPTWLLFEIAKEVNVDSIAFKLIYQELDKRAREEESYNNSF
jgi:hypothetical protein